MQIGGMAPFYRIKKKEDIPQFLTNYKKYSRDFFILGEGSNTFFADHIAHLAICKIEITGKSILHENNQSVTICLGAGENWQKIVDWSVSQNWSGIEALSGIPGTIGAAPVQNIGAYGSEIKDLLVKVEVYDTKIKRFTWLKNSDCHFGYRDSIFKTEPNRWFIVAVVLKLRKDSKIIIPEYKDIQQYFANRNLDTITLLDIKNAIEIIRATKLPNHKLIPNCGSFFKNPIINKQSLQNLKLLFDNIPTFISGDSFKVSAGFLIDKAGYKGKKIGNIEIYPKNALILTNPNGKANFEEIVAVKDLIKKDIYQKFKIKLTEEVNIVS